MVKKTRKKSIVVVLVVSFFCTLLSCGKNSSALAGAESTGEIKIFVRIQDAAAKSSRVKLTEWDKLVTTIYAQDMDTIRDTSDISGGTVTVENIPAGDDRKVDVKSINSSRGTVVHENPNGIDSVDILAGQTENHSIVLTPVCGSIYISLTEVSGDSVWANFITSTDTFETRAARSARTHISLDYIPFNITGTITILVIDSSGDTTCSWSETDYLFQNSNNSLQASFATSSGGGESEGQLQLNVTLQNPGLTVIGGVADTTYAFEGGESGSLYVSEIMHATSKNDYVEIYNSANQTYNGSLLLDLKGTIQPVGSGAVTIPAKSFFVISKDPAAWVDDTVHTLTLYGTGGVLVLRDAADSSIYDWVAYSEESDLEWPGAAAGYSIELDSLPDGDPSYNNFGRHWVQADSVEFNGSQNYGTPGN